MALHGLASITIGVPDVAATVGYYTEFGLTPSEDGWMSTVDGGRQLRVLPAPTRRLLEVTVRADNADDLGAVSSRLSTMDIAAQTSPDGVTAVEPATGVRAVVRIAPRIHQEPTIPPPLNAPGHVVRVEGDQQRPDRSIRRIDPAVLREFADEVRIPRRGGEIQREQRVPVVLGLRHRGQHPRRDVRGPGARSDDLVIDTCGVFHRRNPV